MRIGIDAREAFRPEPRGIGLYVRHLVREFAELAREREFVLYHQLPLLAGAMAIPPNARTHRADLPGGRFHLWERLQMPWRMRRDRVDVYHGTYNTLPPRYRAWPGPPMIVSLHDVIVTWWPDDLDDPFVQYVRAVTKRVVRDAALILTVSEWSRGEICERFDVDPAKVRLTYNGLHPLILKGPTPDAAATVRQRFSDGRPYVFAIGAPLERKNTGRLIEAWARAKASRPDWPHLLLVSGLARHADRFRERAERAGAAEHVRFLPYLTQQELVDVYSGAELSVYPSMVEGWGIPVGEALALGVPVLTSNTSAMPEAGGEFARYFDPADVDSMAHALVEALERYVDEFAALRPRAVAHARTFTWTATARSVLQAYDEVAGRR